MKHAAETSRRITGTEMEWGAMVSGHGDELIMLSHDSLRPAVNRYLRTNGIHYVGIGENKFLQNGARFYEDIRDRREYATPEDDSYIGTCANELVNDKIMADIAMIYPDIVAENAKRLKLRGDEANDIPTQISFTKRVLDDANNGCGYHVSYSADARKMDISMRSLSLYGIFAATRSVVFGAGALLPDGRFTIAQKVLTCNTDYDSDTVSRKPIVNLRKESLADNSRFIRIHDTSGDPTMSPWATRVKLGAGAIVLSMIEAGVEMPELEFDEHLHVIAKEVAFDTKLRRELPLKHHGSLTALEVQTILVNKAKKLSSSHPFNDEELWTLEEWERALYDLRRDPKLTVDRIDWTMRDAVLQRAQSRHGWSWNSARMRAKDRQFSEVAFSGIGKALQETCWSTYMPSQTMIDERLFAPPQTTRAKLRGELIRAIGTSNQLVKTMVNWQDIKIDDLEVTLDDPFVSSHPVVDEVTAMLLSGNSN